MQIYFVIGLLLLALSGSTRSAERLTLVTTDFPPYSTQHQGQVSGVATDIVKATFQEAGLTLPEIHILPWARAYRTALLEKNTLIFSMAHSEERDKHFHWIGEVAPYQIDLYKLKSRTDIHIASLDSARHFIVGGEFDDIKQAYLVKQGFVVGNNLKLVSADELNIRMLFAGRIDLLPFNALSLPIMLKKEGFKPQDVDPVLSLEDISYPLYLAANRNTPESVVRKLTSALTKLHKTGFVKATHRAYLQSFDQLSSTR